MKFHRSVQNPAGCDAGLAGVVDSLGECVVQLDYRWPRCWPVDGPVARYGRGDYATGLIAATRALIKPFFLGTGLRLISDGGGWGGVACVEAVAATLCEGGCGDVPVAWIGGGDLLAAAEESPDVAASLGLTDPAVMSARVHLGAGPIAQALSEGAQVVVTSRYDPAAPLQAAAAVNYGWGLEPTGELAGASLASRLQGARCSGEISEDGSLLLAEAAGDVEVRLPRGMAAGADFDADFGALSVQMTPEGARRVGGAKVSEQHGQWPAAVERASGYVTSPVVICAAESGDDHWADQLLQTLGEPAGAGVEVQLLSAERAAVVSCRSDEAEPCRAFAAAVAALGAQAGGSGYDVVGPWPLVYRESTVEWVAVSRDSVSVSIDTRPASEWY